MTANTKTDTSKSTILVICMGFLLIGMALHQKWALYTSLGVGAISIASSYISQKIEWGWNKLSTLLGYIVPNILLSLVFFVFLLPISLISKLFNKDRLMLSGKHNSYFLDVNRTVDPQSMEKTW
jgi:uncharacterized membrane protein